MQADPVDIGEPNRDVEQPIEENVKDADVLDEAAEKAQQTYGVNKIPATDVGNIADELRAGINGSLNRMLNGEFDIDEARETFSKMVLLEVVRRGRSFDMLTGDLLASDLERTLAEKPELVVRGMRENPYVKAASENLTLDTLRGFVMNDGAKALADKVLGIAKAYDPDAQSKELQMQNQQEMQQQKAESNPMIK